MKGAYVSDGTYANKSRPTAKGREKRQAKTASELSGNHV